VNDVKLPKSTFTLWRKYGNNSYKRIGIEENQANVSALQTGGRD
jgi:hypothetical protein